MLGTLSLAALWFAGAAAAGDTAVAGPAACDTIASGRKVYVVPVEGDVEPAMAAFIGRAVRQALSDPDAVAVLEMDTFGGRVDAAFQIVDTLLQFPAERVVAYVKNKAISAGALIALACGSLYMHAGTTIGDCAPIMYSQEGGPKMLGEKFQSPLRAKFRALAKRNGFPEALAEAMVSDNMVVYRLETADGVRYADSVDYADMAEDARKKVLKRTTVVKRGDLLTMDDAEAAELGFSRGTVATVEELARALGGAAAAVERVEQSWSETFVRFIATIAPLLILLGIAGIYIETRTPGIGLPGILGALCLLLVFGSQYMVGLADYTELLLLVVGVALLLVDVFLIPGFGVVGFLGIAFIAAALLLSMQNFVLPRPEFPWEMDLLMHNLRMLGLSLVGSVAVIVAFLVLVLPRLSRVVDGPYLQTTLSESRVDAGAVTKLAVGESGVAEKPLRPAGMIRVGNRVVDAQTEGDFIESGAAVVVVRIEGNHVFVARKADA